MNGNSIVPGHEGREQEVREGYKRKENQKITPKKQMCVDANEGEKNNDDKK